MKDNIEKLIEDRLSEGEQGYPIALAGDDAPELKAWVRDSGDEVTITFEIDGEKQSAAVKMSKKKKKLTGTRS